MTIFEKISWTMLTAHCHKEPAVIPQLFCCLPSGINSRILSVKSDVCVFPASTIGAQCSVELIKYHKLDIKNTATTMQIFCLSSVQLLAVLNLLLLFDS